VPAGINLPKAAIVLAAVGSGLVGLAFGYLALVFALSGSPDFSFETGQLAFVLPPFALAVFCGWLLRRYADAIRQAGCNVRASLAAVVWLGNLGLALAFALYLLAETFPWLLAAAAFLLALGCAWAIARSLRGLVALAVTAVLAIALQVSEALDTWLGLKGL
jgi:hypothetical protein